MEGLARIPKDRIAVLIGRKGVTRRALEKATNAQALEMNFKGIFLSEGSRILN